MPKNERGFASMDPKKQREIASKGGKAGHDKGFAKMPKEEVREIARKGGTHSHGGGRKKEQ